jgi:PPE family
MLDTTVDPGNIDDGVQAWRAQGSNAAKLVSDLTRDLNKIVSGGWRGAAADAALTALHPINQWSASMADAMELTATLMDAAGFCAGQAKATVPPPKPFDPGEALRSFASGGVAGLVNDVVAQEQQQSEARAEAVRIMTDVYSAPINEYRAAVPTYPQLTDPTLQPPEQAPNPGPAPGPGYPSGRAPGGAASPHGANTYGDGRVAHPLSAPTVHPLSALTAGAQPASVTLQHVTSGVPVPHRSGQVTLDQGTHRPGHVGSEVAPAAAASAPVMGQIAGDPRRARAAGSGIRSGGGGLGGFPGSGGHADRSGRVDAGHPAEFGPRPPALTQENQLNRTPDREARRTNPGEMIAPMGGGLGKGGGDCEHRRPSYLIEMHDVFTDGRTVAPAVIGEDLPEQDD